MEDMEPAIGVLGGSGLTGLDGLEIEEERAMKTPFGSPSDNLVIGRLAGRRVVFLPRHARGHRIAPHEINHRANIHALRAAGVRWLICVCAVGSLREDLHPREVVLVDQIFDRTSRRAEHTFFGGGIVAHISFADPLSAGLRGVLRQACEAAGCRRHAGGTYVNMDGPAFSTRAESETNRRLGFDVIGMTHVAEAKLAREAEIACATLAMVTDYDAWKTDEEPVSAGALLGHLQANERTAKEILRLAVPLVPATPDWPEHRALDGAIITPKDHWPPAMVEKLGVILRRFV